MLPFALSSTYFIVASAAAVAITFATALWVRARFAPATERTANLVAGGLAAANFGIALAIGAIALTATINVDSLRKPVVDGGCNIVSRSTISAVVDGVEIDPRSQQKGRFSLKREDNFILGMNKISEYNNHFRDLIELIMIPVGISFLVIVRFMCNCSRIKLWNIIPRAAISMSSVGASVVGVTLSHHLLFSISNRQIYYLGSGAAYCYDYFAEPYSHLFWNVAFSGALSLIALATLPEAVRLNYQEKE